MSSVFESVMLVCFGLSWPTSIAKSLKSRTAKGKSVTFLYFLELGYIFGMINKVLNGFNFVFWLYLLNFGMILIDIALYYRNRRLDAAADAAAQA